MKRIQLAIEEAQAKFASLFAASLNNGPASHEQYVRYLSFQYHLTRGVQRYFFVAMAHPDFARRRKLRKFLFEFGNEEELHYLVAGKDLRALGLDPLPEPFDVTLWHSYFD